MTKLLAVSAVVLISALSASAQKTKSTTATGRRGGSVSAQGSANTNPTHTAGSAQGSATVKNPSGQTVVTGSAQGSAKVTPKGATASGTATVSGTTKKGKSYGGTATGTATTGQGATVTVSPQNGNSRTKTVPAKQ